MNSCAKGKVGEREWAEFLRSHGFSARRGRQFSGSPDSPDVVSELPFHWEVKRVEALNITETVKKAVEDAGGQVPAIAHRRNGTEWLVTMRANDWIALVKRERFLTKQIETQPKGQHEPTATN